MRYIILVILCAINLSASAQWWRGDFKKHTRYPLITLAKNQSVKRIPKAILPKTKLTVPQFSRTPYNLQICERIVMRSAQHHMRFREYAQASYDFSELAQYYVMENRLSEAKWYYLQSILISKNQSDNQHTINSLISLAMVKADLGDLAQAQQDLAEARDLATITGRINDIKLIDQKIKFVQSNKVWLPKSELRYAEAIEATVAKTK
jgi:hypothetical protein